MELPLLLAGPILRRVDPGLVAVQVFLSRPATVKLTVYEGRVAFDTTNPAFVSSDDPPDPNLPPPRPGGETVRIGDNLHLGMVSARVPPASAKVFQSDFLYSYNVSITTGSTTVDLAGLDLLGAHTVSGVTCQPLGYDDRMLPSFALPPTAIDDLQIAYGSCRRPSYDDGDALAWMDEYLADRVRDPRARIHQLFLGGDQIYADDVADVMMLRVAELGIELIGTRAGGLPLERVKVGKVRKKTGQPTDEDPDAAYTDEPAAETQSLGDLPAGLTSFPLGNRLDVTTHSAQFTSVDGTNHLISFGEFAATYLMAWSPACWGLEVPGALRLATPGATTGPPLRWLDTLTDGEDLGFPPKVFPDRVPEHLYVKAKIAGRAKAKAKKNAGKTPEEIATGEARGRVRSQRVHREFVLGLGRVQRVLANVPTYMILDDHDVTDDYFLNVIWRRRVLQSVLGQVILTNAMLAYALFQDWGNNPVRYDQITTPDRPELGGLLPGDLLGRADEVFLQHDERGPDAEAYAVLGRMFGHDLDKDPTPDGRFPPVKPPISWHFTVDGPKHVVVALDNRTRRSYVSEIGPPGNVSTEALVDQLPRPPLPAGREVLVVIAPLQVIGPPVIDEIVARAIYRIFDLASASDLADDTVSGTRKMPGTNPDALETWAFDPITYEHLLARLAEHQRVVVLSGDVHNAASNLMSYWRTDTQHPARIAQFTSSGFKNVMPVYLRALDRSAMLLQELLRAKLGVDRLGWTRPEEDLVLLPTGRTEADLVAVTRAKLLRSPVLLATHGWLDDNEPGVPPDAALTSRLNPARPPEWRWRIAPLIDQRVDADRPSPIRPKALDDALIETQLADPATAFQAMQTVAARHQRALDQMRNTRQMMFRSNFGICRFETKDESAPFTAVGEVYTSAIDPETQLPVLGPYMVHRAQLGPVTESAPEVLRVPVLSKVPIPEPQP